MKRILIANRGEIAVRIIRTCKDMGFHTISVYSSPDKDALHVTLADQAICIGGAKSVSSYLNMDAIISAAVLTKADAIHPGYGFLSENPDFVERCIHHNIIFIGPGADIMKKLGDKSNTRQMIKATKVPIVPGSSKAVTLDEAKQTAEEIGYPILLKAAAGGGGRGIRAVNSEHELSNAYAQAKLEAKSAFGNDDMYVEKLLLEPKHIEVQIIRDRFGNCMHLGERDCSIQRRNQKIIEETPASHLSSDLRKKIHTAAVLIANHIEYENVGTVEFLVEGENFYFMEINTRIQVEHPVTEMVTGLDLVREQLLIAQGKPLSFQQKDVVMNGVSIEARITVEDPKNDFIPKVGSVEVLHLPGGVGVRIDHALYQGYRIPPFYDSMIAKVIVHGATRLQAINKLRRVLSELVIEGVSSNQKMLYMICHNPTFVKGDYHIRFMDQEGASVLYYR